MSEEEPPLVAGPIYGLRQWRVSHRDGGPRLQALARGTVWPAGGDALDARCVGAADHPAPASECACGIYAIHPTVDTARELMEAAYAGSVVGIIEAWGAIEVHAEGFRAAHARVHAFVLPRQRLRTRYERLVSRLARAYRAEVVIVPSAEGLRRHCAEHNLGLSQRSVGDLLEPRLAEERRQARRRRWRELPKTVLEGAITAVAVVFYGGWILLLGGGLLLGIVNADETTPARSPAPAAGRELAIAEQAVIGDDRRAGYVAVVENRSRRHAFLGVHPEGEVTDVDGVDVAPLYQGEDDLEVNLAPVQRGVIVTELELLPARPLRYSTRLAARHQLSAGGRAPVTIERLRVDRGLCLLTATVTSRGAEREAFVTILVRGRRGRIERVLAGIAGPLRAGRQLQVLRRLEPRLCGAPASAFEAYPDLSRRQLSRARPFTGPAPVASER